MIEFDKNPQKSLEVMKTRLADAIEKERIIRLSGRKSPRIIAKPGFCSPEGLQAIVDKYASGDGVTGGGVRGVIYPTKIEGPDPDDKFWLFYIDRGDIEITTQPILTPEEMLELSKNPRNVIEINKE